MDMEKLARELEGDNPYTFTRRSRPIVNEEELLNSFLPTNKKED